MIVRPVQVTDLPALLALARQAGCGLTSLPANEERLLHRLRWAQRTFAEQVERADADYLFVLEDDDQQVVGVSALTGAVGLREPWYSYRVGQTVSSSPDLGIERQRREREVIHAEFIAWSRNPQDQQQQQQEAAARGLDETLEDLNARMQAWSTGLRFTVDEDAQRVVVSIVDNNTGEVIRTVPSDAVLKVAKMIVHLQGQVVNTKV